MWYPGKLYGMNKSFKYNYPFRLVLPAIKRQNITLLNDLKPKTFLNDKYSISSSTKFVSRILH